MPALSPTMEKGNLARWLVREGDRVRTGDLGGDRDRQGDARVRGGRRRRRQPDPGRRRHRRRPGRHGDRAARRTGGRRRRAADRRRGRGRRTRGRHPWAGHARAGAGALDAGRAGVRRDTDRAAAGEPAGRAHRDATRDRPRRNQGNRRRRQDRQGRSRTAAPARVTRAGHAARTIPTAPEIPHETARLTAMRRTIARRLAEAKRTMPLFHLGVERPARRAADVAKRAERVARRRPQRPPVGERLPDQGAGDRARADA